MCVECYALTHYVEKSLKVDLIWIGMCKQRNDVKENKIVAAQ